MSLIFATQLTAIATAVLAVFAIVTAVFAIRAFRKQSQEVSDQASMLEIQSEQLAEQRKVNAEQIRVLALQAAELRESLDERKREAEQRRRAQAGRVFIRAEPCIREGEPISTVAVIVKNTSEQPIYDLVLLWRNETGEWIDAGGPVDSLILMPEEEHKWGTGVEPVPIHSFLADPSVIRAAVVFRDAADVYWRLRSDGHFDEEPETG
jgi:hypothetical protein